MTGPSERQHRRMSALRKLAGATAHMDRLALTQAIVQRPIASSNDRSETDVARVIRDIVAR